MSATEVGTWGDRRASSIPSRFSMQLSPKPIRRLVLHRTRIPFLSGVRACQARPVSER
jgi:hypothetical protein